VNWNNDQARCELARAAIADSLVGHGAPVDTEALETHLASCAECRRYRDDCRILWATLGELPVPAPAADATQRFEQQLSRAVRAAPDSEILSAARAHRTPWARLALAASLVVAALAGYAAASWKATHTVAPASVAPIADPRPQFLLLLYDVYTAAPPPSAAEMSSLIAEYSAWGRGLRATGHLVSAEKLSDDPSQWYGSTPVQSDARVGGFFLIRARDLAEAQRIAAGCPHVRHGGRVELRAIHPT
jgi:hypothetical protein